MKTTPDIAFEIWAPDEVHKDWQIVVDRNVLGSHRTQIDAIEYAKSVARDAAREANLHTIVVRCKPGGKRQRIAAFGGFDA
jgi:hypothetical protein